MQEPGGNFVRSWEVTWKSKLPPASSVPPEALTQNFYMVGGAAQ